MGSLLDLLMGNESPFADPSKKRQDFPYETSVPLVQTIIYLLEGKKNFQGQVFLSSNNPLDGLESQEYFDFT
jgi:hypothetical protein